MRTAPFLILVIVTLSLLLAACAPATPSTLSQRPASTETTPAPASPTAMPSKPTVEPKDTPKKSSALKPGQAPFLLLSTWSTEGKQAAIYPVDPASGEALPGYAPLALGENGFVHAFSQDGKRLAVVAFHGQSCDSFSGGSRCRGGKGELHLVDLPAWQIVSAALPVDGTIEALAFSPDAARLALASSARDGYDLVVVDGNSGETLAQRSLDFPPEILAFTADGAFLVVYGTPLNEPAGIARPDPPRAVLLDATSLETHWEQALPQVTSGSWCLQNCDKSHELVLFANYHPGTALSPDGQQLYIVHADEDRLTTVDFASRDVRTAAIAEATSWFERLLALTAGVARAKGGMEGSYKVAALSADGRVLYTAGQATHATPDEQSGWRIEQEAFPVQAIEAETGRLLASYALERQGSYGLRLSPDGATLVLDGWEGDQRWSELLDTESIKTVAEVKGWELQAVQGPDGALTWLGSRLGPGRTTLALLNPETFEPLQTWKEYGYWLTP